MRGVSAWLLSLLVLPFSAPAEESACEVVTATDADALSRFQFDADINPLSRLPDDGPYRLREIAVVRQNVFETTDGWLERSANRYHWRTRENVVRSILPMVQGDAADRRLLEEAERILRAKLYLYDARIIPWRVCGDELDIFVVTRDVWTLSPRLTLSRSGGENTLGFGLSDRNFLGTGKGILLNYQSDEDRSGYTVGYNDPNVGDSRWAMDLMVDRNDDGEGLQGSLRYPFYSLDSRHAFLLAGNDLTRDEGLHFLGDRLWEFRAQTQRLRVAAGRSSGVKDRFVNRLLVGFGYEDQNFDLPDLLQQAVPSLEAPDRNFSYPFVAFERIEDDHEKRVNLDRVQRIEDVSLGRRIYGELGYSGSVTGGSGDYLIGRMRVDDAAWITPKQLVTLRGRLNGYFDLDEKRSENLVADVHLTYRFQQAESWSLLVQGSATLLDNPTLDRQLRLGGEEGLRGYPTRYQIGDRRFLITLEERFFSNLYPWRLFRVGAAAFLDVGRAWFQSEAPAWVPRGRDGGHFGVLSNVGVGLRLESTRTRDDTVMHIDVAFPLRSGPNVRGMEITLTAKQTL